VKTGENTNTTLPLAESAEPASARSCLAVRWITASGMAPQLLTGAHLTLGRGAESDLRIESSGVSRRHAELTRQGPVFAIRDLESRNGTFLNGRRVQHGALSEGDVLRLGDAVGVISRVHPDGHGPPALEFGDVLFGPDLAEPLEQMRRAAPSDLPMVILGETGVGKECAARAVHLLSGRRGAFHAVNCAALPTALAEAELFGYRKGAFTGADHAGGGHLRAADGGTLLLDELAELSLPVQGKLLRALQEKEVMPLGETRAVRIDLRIVAACQAPLDELVRAKRLRQDLAARLSGLTVTIAPLRARRSDAGYLFGYFLRRFSGGRPPAVDPKLIERLLLYSWPSNVRELQLLTQRLVVLHGDQPLLKQSMLPEALGRSESVEAETKTPSVAVLPDRNEHDLRALTAELLVNGGNLSRAAAKVGISRQRAYRLTAGRAPSELSLADSAGVSDEDESRGPHV